jgi:hypothetical protein
VASDIPARHDSADHVLDVPLPTARRFALRLRGLHDAETREHDLVALPVEPGRSDTLIIVRDPTRGGGTAEVRMVKSTLARFWIEGNRLHFRWEPSLRRTLIEPALALRDCILEVRGGGVRLNVALRGLWKDPSAMMVRQGPRVIPWERYGRPSRRLAIRSCEVNTAAGWEEVPPAGGDPNHRQWLVTGKTGDPAAGILTLGVRLGDDAQTLSPELTPPVARAKAEIASLEREHQALTSDIAAKTKSINGMSKQLEKLRTERDKGFAMLNQIAAARSKNLRISVPFSQEYIQNRISVYYSPEISKIQDALQTTRNYLSKAQRQLMQVEAEIGRQGQWLQTAEALQTVPIRMRLGVLIEGEAVDVAWIGPW